MPVAVLLTVAGLQVPVIPLLEVAGRAGATEPEHIGAITVNVGVTWLFTVTVRVVVKAH